MVYGFCGILHFNHETMFSNGFNVLYPEVVGQCHSHNEICGIAWHLKLVSCFSTFMRSKLNVAKEATNKVKWLKEWL